VSPPWRPRGGEDGDTLIELLIAIVIIALTVSALLGALITAITSSSEHRSLATIDSLLNTFAQSAEYEVQQAPGLFQNCTSNPYGVGGGSPYRIVSAPTPATGPAGTAATLFVSGFVPGHALTVTVGGAASTITSGSQTNSNGDQAVTFVIPPLGLGAQAVVVSDGNATPTPATSFTVTGGSPSSTTGVSQYSMTISTVTQWDAQSDSWVALNSGSCPQSGVQRITAFGLAPDGTSGSIDFVVLGKAFTTVLVTSAPANPVLGNALTFTATIIPPTSTTPRPAGTVSWAFTPTPGNPSCPNSTNLGGGAGNTATATCTVTNAQVANYDVTAAYTGTNYSDGSGSGAASVGRATPTVTVLSSPSNPLPGSKLTFTATVTAPLGTDPTPKGTVQWAFTNSPGNPTCPNAAVSGTGNAASATCVVNSAQLGTYSVTAAYSGDGNYTPAASSVYSITVSKGTPSVTVKPSPTNPQPGSTFTFTATVAGPGGAPTPTGTVTWTVTAPSGPAPTCPASTLNAAGQGTCMVTNALAGTYQVSAAYGGDGRYNVTSGPGSVVVALSPAGATILGVPNSPADGKPDNGDQIVYTFNQQMSANSILNNWTGATRGVTASFSRQGNQTALVICTNQFCNQQVNLGTVALGDTGASHYTGGFGSVAVSAQITMTTNASGESVVTVTLTQTAFNISALTPPTTTTTLVWTPSPAATNSGGAPCSTAPVTEAIAMENF